MADLSDRYRGRGTNKATTRAIDHHLQSVEFARKILARRLGVELNDTAMSTRTLRRAQIPEFTSLLGFMALSYVQVAAVISGHLGATAGQPKNFAMVASRTALHALRSGLPEDARAYVESNWQDIRDQLITEYLVANRHDNDPAEVLAQPVTATDEAGTYEVGEYLESILRPDAPRLIDQNQALEIRTHMTTLDDGAGSLHDTPLVVVELRHHHKGRPTFDVMETEFRQVVHDLDRHMRRAPRAVPVEVPAGMVLLDPDSDDGSSRAAQDFPAQPDSFIVFAHGGANGGPLVRGTELTPESVAALIRADPRWGNRRIVLMTCGSADAGLDSFAARLAGLLAGEVTVVAPAGTAWTTPDGRAYVTGTAGDFDGSGRPRLGTPGSGWREFDATDFTELGPDLPTVNPPSGTAGPAFPWGTTYAVQPIVETQPEIYHRQAELFERNLGAWLFQQPHVRYAALAAVARLREVLARAGTPSPLRSFVRDSRASAGQVGEGLDDAAIDAMLTGGNLRELMTAFYNAAYYNADGRNESSPAPATLKSVVQDMLADQDLSEAEELGLDTGALSTVMDEYRTWRRTVMYAAAGLQGKGHVFATDPFALGVLAANSDWSTANLAFLLSQHGKITRPGPQPRETSGTITAAELDGLGIALSDRERRYLAPDDDQAPLPWVTGQATWQLDPRSWWYGSTHDAAGMPVTAGVSGTTARMLAAFDWLRVPGVSREDFQLAVMAWMLTSKDHSLYELLRGAEIMNVGPRVSAMTSAEQMYEGLTAFGITPSQIRGFSAMDVGALPAEFAGVGTPRMLPHEAAYAITALGVLGGDGPYFSGVSGKDLHQAAELHHALRLGTGPLDEWFERNPGAREAMRRGFTFAHLVALRAYTSESHQMINMMAPQPGVPREINALRVRDQVAREVDLAVDRVLDRRPHGLSHALANDRVMTALMGRLGTAVKAGRQHDVDFVVEELSAHVKTLGAVLPGQMAVHFDMAVEALRLLPPVTAETFRGDWAAPVGSMYYRKAFSTSQLTSTARNKDKALPFARKYTGTWKHPVLLTIGLRGRAGRDISGLSQIEAEDEVLLLPGATFASEKPGDDSGFHSIVVAEQEPVGIAAAAEKQTATRLSTVATDLSAVAASVITDLTRRTAGLSTASTRLGELKRDIEARLDRVRALDDALDRADDDIRSAMKLVPTHPDLDALLERSTELRSGTRLAAALALEVERAASALPDLTADVSRAEDAGARALSSAEAARNTAAELRALSADGPMSGPMMTRLDVTQSALEAQILAATRERDTARADITDATRRVETAIHEAALILGRPLLALRVHEAGKAESLAEEAALLLDNAQPPTPQSGTGSYAEHFLLSDVNTTLRSADLDRAGLPEVEAALAGLTRSPGENHRVLAWRVAHRIAALRDPGTPPPFPERPRLRGGGTGVESEVPTDARLRARALAGLDALPDDTILELAQVLRDDARPMADRFLAHYLGLRVDQLVEQTPGLTRVDAVRSILAHEPEILNDVVAQINAVVALHRIRYARMLESSPDTDEARAVLAAALGASPTGTDHGDGPVVGGQPYQLSVPPAGPDQILHALIAADGPLLGKLLWPAGPPAPADADLAAWLEDDEKVRKAIRKGTDTHRLTRAAELIRDRIGSVADGQQLLQQVADALAVRIHVLDDTLTQVADVGHGPAGPLQLVRADDGSYAGLAVRARVSRQDGDSELDRAYGELAGPKRVKAGERDDRGDVRVNPLRYPLSEFPRAFLDRHAARWHYVVDEQGEIVIGTEEVGTVLTDAEWRELAGWTSTEVDELKAELDHQGHPTLGAGFTADGRTVRRPARIAGEISYDGTAGRWEINDKSGRHMSAKVRQNVTPDRILGWVERVAGRFHDRFPDVEFHPVLTKAGRPADLGTRTGLDVIAVNPELVRRDLDWLAMVNPSRHDNGAGRTNCVLVATVVDDVLRTGTVQIAPPTSDSPIADLLNYTQGPLLAVPDQGSLTRVVERAGPGARGIVVARRPGNEIAHAFNVVNHDGEALYLDGQSGDLAVWPTDADAYFLATAVDPAVLPDWPSHTPTGLAGSSPGEAGPSRLTTPARLGLYETHPELLYEVAGATDPEQLVADVVAAARRRVQDQITRKVAWFTPGGRYAVKVGTEAIAAALRDDLPSFFVDGGRTFDVKDGWGRWHSVTVAPTRFTGAEQRVDLDTTKFDTRVDATTATRETRSSGESLTVGTGATLGGRVGPGGGFTVEMALAQATENTEYSTGLTDSHNVRGGRSHLVRSPVRFTVTATRTGQLPPAVAMTSGGTPADGDITADVSFHALDDIATATARTDGRDGPFDVSTLVENVSAVRIKGAAIPGVPGAVSWNHAAEHVLRQLTRSNIAGPGSVSREQVRALLTESNVLGHLMPSLESPAHSPLILSDSRRQAVGLEMSAEVTSVAAVADIAKSSFRWQPGITETVKQEHLIQVGGGAGVVPIRWGFGIGWIQARFAAGFRRTTGTSARQSGTSRTGTEFKDVANTLAELKARLTISPAVRLNALRHPMRRTSDADPVVVDLTVLARVPQDKLAELLAPVQPPEAPEAAPEAPESQKPAPPFAVWGGHAMPLGMSRFSGLRASTETLIRRVGGGFLPRYRRSVVSARLGLAGSAAERQRNQAELDRVLSVPGLRQHYTALLNGGVSAVLTRSGMFGDRHTVVHVEAAHPLGLRYAGVEPRVAVRNSQGNDRQDAVAAGGQWRGTAAVEGAFIGRIPGKVVNTGLTIGAGVEGNVRRGHDGGVETSGQETALHGGTTDSEAYEGDLELVVKVYTYRTSIGWDLRSRIGLGRIVKGMKTRLAPGFTRTDIRLGSRSVPRYTRTERQKVRVLYAKSAVTESVTAANPMTVGQREQGRVLPQTATDLSTLRGFVDRRPDQATVTDWQYVESMPGAGEVAELALAAARQIRVGSHRQLAGLRGDVALTEGMPLRAELSDRVTVTRQIANLSAMTEAHWAPEPLTTMDDGGRLDIALAARITNPRIVGDPATTTSENASGGGTQVWGSTTTERQFLARVTGGFSLRKPGTAKDRYGGGATGQAGYQRIITNKLKRFRDRVGGFIDRNVNNRKGKARTYLVVADLRASVSAEIASPARFPKSMVPAPLQPGRWERHKAVQHSAEIRNGIYLRVTEAQAGRLGLLDGAGRVAPAPASPPAFLDKVREQKLQLPPGRSHGQGLLVFHRVPSLVGPAIQALSRVPAGSEQATQLKPVLDALTGTGLADPMLNRNRILQMLASSGVKRSWGNLFDGGVSLIHAEAGKVTQNLHDVRLEASLRHEITFAGFQADHDDMDIRTVGTRVGTKVVRTTRGGQGLAGAAGTGIVNPHGKQAAIGGGHQYAATHLTGHTSVVETERREINISSARGVKARIVLRPTFEIKVFRDGKAVPGPSITFESDVTVDRWAGDLRTVVTAREPVPLDAPGAYTPGGVAGAEPGWAAVNGLLVPPLFTPEDIGDARALQEMAAAMLSEASARLRLPGYPGSHQVRAGLTPDVLLSNAARLLSPEMLDFPAVTSTDVRLRSLLPQLGLEPIAVRLAGLDATVYREHVTQSITGAGTSMNHQSITSTMPRLLLGRGYMGDPYQALENSGTGPASGDTAALASGEGSSSTSFGNAKPENHTVLLEYVTRPRLSGTLTNQITGRHPHADGTDRQIRLVVRTGMAEGRRILGIDGNAPQNAKDDFEDLVRRQQVLEAAADRFIAAADAEAEARHNGVRQDIYDNTLTARHRQEERYWKALQSYFRGLGDFQATHVAIGTGPDTAGGPHARLVVPAGVALLDNGPEGPTAEAARTFPPRPDSYFVFFHAGRDGTGPAPEAVASIITGDERSSGRAVVLMACGTAEDTGNGFAARLARALPPGTRVIAPNGTAWTTPDGQAYVTRTEYDPDGRPRLLPPDTAHGWRALTATTTDELGTDLPATVPRHDDDAVSPVAWGSEGRPYSTRPITELEAAIHRDQVLAFERNLGSRLAGQPRVRHAAREAVAGLRGSVPGQDPGVPDLMAAFHAAALVGRTADRDGARTTASLVSAFDRLALPDVTRHDFVLAVMAWGLTTGQQSLHDIMRGAATVQAGPAVAKSASAEELHRALIAFGLTSGQVRDLTGTSPGDIAAVTGRDVRGLAHLPNMLPHEAAYVKIALGAFGDGEPRFHGLSTEMIQTAVHFSNELRTGTPALETWFTQSPGTREAVARSLTFAHVLAIQMYTGDDHELINLMAPRKAVPRVAAAALVGRRVKNEITSAVARVKRGVPHGLSSSLSTNQAVIELFDDLEDAVGSRDKAKIATATRKLDTEAAQLARTLPDQMAAHFDMIVDALQLLPPVTAAVFRGDGAAPVGSMYDRSEFTTTDLSSTSRLRAAGLRFALDHEGIIDRPILLEMTLNGHAGRDISALSNVSNESEVLLLPGATFKIENVDRKGSPRVATVREQPSMGVARQTTDLTVERAATHAIQLASVMSSTGDALDSLRERAADRTVVADRALRDIPAQIARAKGTATATMARLTALHKPLRQAQLRLNSPRRELPEAADALEQRILSLHQRMGTSLEAMRRRAKTVEAIPDLDTAAVRDTLEAEVTAFMAAAGTVLHATTELLDTAAAARGGDQQASTRLDGLQTALDIAFTMAQQHQDRALTAWEQLSTIPTIAAAALRDAEEGLAGMHAVEQQMGPDITAAGEIATEVTALIGHATRTRALGNRHEKVNAGMALTDAALYGPRTRDMAVGFPPVPGSYVVFVHATDGIPTVDGTEVSAEALAVLITRDTRSLGRTIVLVAHGTANDPGSGFAARLARALPPGTRVVAPAGTAWTTAGGQAFVTGTAYDVDGRPRLLASNAAHGWRALTATTTDELGTDLPAAPHRSDDAGDDPPFPWSGMHAGAEPGAGTERHRQHPEDREVSDR
ncbi:toxin glutamine deamidase domain-containing protein [Winogradskya consettensis]|nr:toxin glutamine deamidase domain-containing protein [Actinoplanes consettensis]